MKFTRMSATLEACIERAHADLNNPDRLTYVEIEEIIEQTTEDEDLRDNLADWEIQEIRDEAYRSNGWFDDPFPVVEDSMAG